MEPTTIHRFMGRDDVRITLDPEEEIVRALVPQPEDLVEIPNEDGPEDEVLDLRVRSY